MSSPQLGSRSERSIVLLIAAVQFVNILDFVMVLPLGPMLSPALGIPANHIGYVGGSYTAAAAVAGLLAAPVLERFDRRWALAVAMVGLVGATGLGGLAQSPLTLYTARVIAGLFGGPATALAFAIVADVIPPERRGRAVSVVMTALSVATVVGVPIGLWLAEGYGWRTPFFAVALLGLGVTAGVVFFLPPLRQHLVGDDEGRPKVGVRQLLGRRVVQVSFTLTAVSMMASFLVIPVLPTYQLGNLKLPPELLKWNYLVGGLVGFFNLRWVGALVDRYGSFRVGRVGAVLLALVCFLFFVDYPFDSFSPQWPVMALFTALTVALGIRNVANNTLTSKVPGPKERARFQSLQSSVHHAASATGAFLSSIMLSEVPVLTTNGAALDGPGKLPARAVGMPAVASLTIALSLLVPLLLRWLEPRVIAPRAPPSGAEPVGLV